MRTSAGTLLLALGFVVAACAPGSVGPGGAAWPSGGPQVTVCGNLDQPVCAEVLRAVASQDPGIAASPLVVADYGKDLAAPNPGPDSWIVAYVPAARPDPWLGPPVFLVLRGNPTGYAVQPWPSDRPLPAFYTDLLRTSGVPGH